MKKYLLLIIALLFSIASFSQVTHVQIKTNNPNIFVNNGGLGNYGSSTSDTGLNTIFTNNQITGCYRFTHPVDNVNTIFAVCPNVNLQNFIQNLINYNSLVTKVIICPQPETFGDVVMTTLLNGAIGIPTGVDGNGIITTNDSGLNQIFNNYNVSYFSRSFPTSSQSTRVYTAKCDCNVANLKTALNNYNTVIENTEFVGVAFLSIEDYTIKNTSIYPNPFSSTFAIDTQESISKYAIFDLTGKKVLETEFKQELEVESSKLNSGIFFMKISFQNGKVGNYKLIKK